MQNDVYRRLMRFFDRLGMTLLSHRVVYNAVSYPIRHPAHERALCRMRQSALVSLGVMP